MIMYLNSFMLCRFLNTLKIIMKNENQKKILSLDGGGIRGALTLGFLEHIEKLLQLKENNPKLKLCDYFDLIGGTSTGAIIAAGLSICSGQVILATVLDFSQYFRSDSLGVKPSLCA